MTVEQIADGEEEHRGPAEGRAAPEVARVGRSATTCRSSSRRRSRSSRGRRTTPGLADHHQGPRVDRSPRARHAPRRRSSSTARPRPTPRSPRCSRRSRRPTAATSRRSRWALAALHEPTRVRRRSWTSTALGHLAKVQRLDGSPAFDPEQLAGMVSLDKLATLAGDESESVRQLVATVLSRNADPKWTDALIKLVQDKTVEVAREAAVGLGKIAQRAGDAAAPRRARQGRQGLAPEVPRGAARRRRRQGPRPRAPERRQDKRDTEKFQTKQIFDMLQGARGSARRRRARRVHRRRTRTPHWKTEAALRLAEIGDLRAVPTLAWRMKQDPLKLYNERRRARADGRDDNERVVAARMLADLAHPAPGQAPTIRAQAEDGVLFWVDRTSRSRTRTGCASSRSAVAEGDAEASRSGRSAGPAARRKARSRRFPSRGRRRRARSATSAGSKDPAALGHPREAAQPPAREARRDDGRRSMQGGLAIIGMTLRALGVGASDGFAQWGDPKAYPTAREVHRGQAEQRAVAHRGVLRARVGRDRRPDEGGREEGPRLRQARPEERSSFAAATSRRSSTARCRRRPRASSTCSRRASDLEVRHQAARAIGFGGITTARSSPSSSRS